MIKNINDSKKHFFVWTIVTIVIFVATMIGGNALFQWASEESGEEIPQLAKTLLYVCAYAVATFPIGFAVRRKFMHWYMPMRSPSVGTVKDDYIEGRDHPLRAIFRFIRFDFALLFDLVLLAFYCAVSLVIGLFIFPYHITSGIVFLCQKKI